MRGIGCLLISFGLRREIGQGVYIRILVVVVVVRTVSISSPPYVTYLMPLSSR
jgi:hypothetical protein